MEKNVNTVNDMDNMERAAKEFKEDKYKFEAFISYRHLEPDATIAQEIHKMIETFKVPKEFYNQGQRPSFRVFRDREELTAKDLSDSIEDALKNSKFLIVICSKRTKLSEWCIKEIETFRKLHGDDRIIPVLIEGEPHESFPQPLKELKRGGSEKGETQDVLAVDLRPEEVKALDFIGYEKLETENTQKHEILKKESTKLLKTEKYRLMATILGCSYGDLKQRDKERRNKLIMSVSSIVAVALLIFGVFMTNAYQNAEKARREAVQSNASILLKNSREMIKDGDSIKAILVAQEAMKPIDIGMERYQALNSEAQGIFNDAIYHNGASMLTTIPTKNKMTYFSLSTDANALAFGYGNNSTAIYNPNNGELVKLLEGHNEQVKIVDFSSDNKMLASSSFGDSIIVYDPEEWVEISRITKSGIPMLTRFSKDSKKLFTANLTSAGMEFSVYNTETWETEDSYLAESTIKYAEFSEDGKEILMVNGNESDVKLGIYDIKTTALLRKYDAPEFESNLEEVEELKLLKDINWAKYSLDGKSILAVASGEMLKYNMDDGKLIFNEHKNIDINAAPIETKNGDKIVVKTANRIDILSGETGAILDEIYFEGIKIVSFAFHEDTNTVVVVGENGKIGIWKDGAIVEKNLDYGRGVPMELKFTKDGSKLITSAHDNQIIKIIDINPKLIEEPIPAQLIAVSNDSTKVLYFDGESFSIWNGKGSELKKIDLDPATITRYIPEVRSYNITNDGRYTARLITEINDERKESKRFVEIYDTVDGTKNNLEVQDFNVGLTLTKDSKSLILIDDINGLRVFDNKTGEIILEHKNILSNTYRVLLSEDGKSIAINRFSGISEIYDLESGEIIDKIPGEILYLNGEDSNRVANGIYNNTGFRWKAGKLDEFELDPYCSETPITFGDRNIYNNKTERLLMIRNNEFDRVIYLVDFKTGNLMMSFKSSLTDYRINGYLSPDGNTIALDQYYHIAYDKEDYTKNKSYQATAIYEILGEEETKKEIEKISDGRELTQEEKVQIGIKSD
ncbi:TIR domain-containing protein [Microaceticoccus formicicus]|uniref:TIR domain-containing protein n=1 Tax=Microaceticoccus formicicus TaxID=3118105 RepID=UPI003CD02A9B|nr:toll/interleukin-1 receptor domain-containing protein [Peptoniphilaceae bacterium AMB_02]